jgi:thiol-disulfide isomerase/thioredoxin
MDKKVLGIIIVLVAIASFLGGASFTQWQYQKTGDQKQAGVTPSPAAQQPTQVAAEELNSTIGNFLVLKDEPCEEDGKPLIYFFGRQTCPHCSWEHPIVEDVVEEFGDLVSFHNNMDSNEDMDVFQKYGQINNGAIPFIILGCQYARLGSGELSGEETEKANLTALLCKLTNSQSEKVCSGVKDLIGQIKEE